MLSRAVPERCRSPAHGRGRCPSAGTLPPPAPADPRASTPVRRSAHSGVDPIPWTPPHLGCDPGKRVSRCSIGGGFRVELDEAVRRIEAVARGFSEFHADEAFPAVRVIKLPILCGVRTTTSPADMVRLLTLIHRERCRDWRTRPGGSCSTSSPGGSTCRRWGGTCRLTPTTWRTASPRRR